MAKYLRVARGTGIFTVACCQMVAILLALYLYLFAMRARLISVWFG